MQFRQPDAFRMHSGSRQPRASPVGLTRGLLGMWSVRAFAVVKQVPCANHSPAPNELRTRCDPCRKLSPQGHGAGHDLRLAYVEQFWLSSLGPTDSDVALNDGLHFLLRGLAGD